MGLCLCLGVVVSWAAPPGISGRGRRGSGWVKNEVGTRSRREDENWGIWLDVIVVVPPGISNRRVGPLPGSAQRAPSTPPLIKFSSGEQLEGVVRKLNDPEAESGNLV